MTTGTERPTPIDCTNDRGTDRWVRVVAPAPQANHPQAGVYLEFKVVQTGRIEGSYYFSRNEAEELFDALSEALERDREDS